MAPGKQETTGESWAKCPTNLWYSWRMDLDAICDCSYKRGHKECVCLRERHAPYQLCRHCRDGRHVMIRRVSPQELSAALSALLSGPESKKPLPYSDAAWKGTAIDAANRRLKRE